MSVDILYFQKKTTLEVYADKANKDNDRVLDDEELVSLFNNLENDEAKYRRRIDDNKKNRISRSIFTGLLTAGGLSVISKNYRNWKSFGLAGVAFGFGAYVGHALYNNYNTCQLEDIQIAKEEYKRIMALPDKH